ncbi:FadR/GntR family transcriptional regulator [Actinomadura sp. WAC 06369]|uniref:FadR/GntR family transcriptional regulator n=1 Tax=Actinomadura sp. WAC 06369 TaxID=2203193 RepID=UPI000F7724D4|nr:FCD domain-containing protein [Actinomadura sp. WAC 06369]RSN64333.1 FadR family transcriptional regulator [Actinomadura sp. WAC 06369]
MDATDAGAGTGGAPDKLASRVARRIEAEVIAQGWPVGRVLDSEPVLRERYGVSRGVLREAARLLEHHQVARMRRGPGGGLVVCAPDAAPTVAAVVVYIEHVGAGLRDVLHARRLIEPVLGRLAAERIDEDGIARLRATHAAELSPARPGEWSGGLFHSVLSEVTGNPVLQVFADVLEQLAYRYVALARPMPADEVRRFTKDSHVRHAAVLDAVVAGDAPLAQVELIRHLDEVAEWFRGATADHGAGTGDADGGGPAVRLAPEPVGLAAGRTLAEGVATRVYEDIVRGGLRPGTVLGSEAELMERYDTSRAVLRAAVRLLEHHAVATSRRGPGGGLVVTRQEPRAAIDATALYLAYRRATAADLRVVREAIEVGLVAQLPARRAEPDVAARLAALRDRLDRPRPDDPDPDPDLDFHAVLAEPAGNPVLALFLRIITELSSRTGTPGGCGDDAGARHREILDAVLDGDAGLAQYRMRRHLSS